MTVWGTTVWSVARSRCRSPTPGSHQRDLLICSDRCAFWCGQGSLGSGASPLRPFERPLRRTGRRRRHRSHLFGRAGHGRAFRHGGRDEATGARAFSSSWAVGPSRPSAAGDGAHPRLGADELLPLTCHRAGHLRLAQTGAGPPRLSSSRAHGQPALPVTLRGQCGAVGRHGSWAERTTNHTGATARWSGACGVRPPTRA
jgi:hypothetical protein